MHILSLVAQKGGTGKSMLALNLAVAAERAGHRVAMVDLDPQGTAASWQRSRTSQRPFLVSEASADRLPETISSLALSGFSLTLIDTPGGRGGAAQMAAQLASLCLVPVRPCEADLRATMPTLRELSALGRPYAIIVNQAPPRNAVPDPVRLPRSGPVLPVAVAARIDHQYAYALGQSVQEFAPNGKAAAEIGQLWREIACRLGSAQDDGDENTDPPVWFRAPSARDEGRTKPLLSANRVSRATAVGPRPN